MSSLIERSEILLLTTVYASQSCKTVVFRSSIALGEHNVSLQKKDKNEVSLHVPLVQVAPLQSFQCRAEGMD